MSRVTRSKRARSDSDDEGSDDRSKSPSPATKKARADSDATTVSYWEYKTAKGWTKFDDKDSDVLNKAYDKDPKGSPTIRDLTFNLKAKTDYIFDFKKMIQTNAETKNTRQIRKITATAPADDSDTMKDDDEAGYAKLVRRHSLEWSDDGEKKTSSKKSSTKGKKGKKEEEEKAAPKLPPLPPACTLDEIKSQARLGAQSCRARCTYDKIDYGFAVKKDVHATHCFDRMIENEKRLCGEYAVFYHSYSYAALLYEVQAAVACVLFRFKSKFATLPRLLVAPYHDIPDADALMKLFPTLASQDHHPTYRAVAICGTTSLLAPDSEAPPSSVFLSGYSCTDLSFMGVLEQLLQSCYVPKKDVKSLAKKIVALSEKHGLDVSQFGGKGCASGRAGHMLQIFVKRHLVDRYLYAALPYGVIDHKRMPLRKFMDSKGPMQGQVRILCHPTIFMRANCVRMFVLSADPTFHKKREQFQEELTALLNVVVGADDTRTAAARGIHGGYLPNWYDSADQSQLAAVDNKYK